MEYLPSDRQNLRRLGRIFENDELTNIEIRIKIPMEIHKNLASGCIIINYPGFEGSIDGYNNKYIHLADFMQEKIGAVIRISNNRHSGLDYKKSVQDDLRAVINYAVKNSEGICGAKEPKIYLLGFSAGASAVAAVAHKFPSVQKILLISPSYDAGEDAVIEGLAKFSGEVYILGGADDDFFGPTLTQEFSLLAKNASKNKLVIIPNCDHYFKGKENGLIMSKAPLWAFLGDQNFPSIEGGIELY